MCKQKQNGRRENAYVLYISCNLDDYKQLSKQLLH